MKAFTDRQAISFSQLSNSMDYQSAIDYPARCALSEIIGYTEPTGRISTETVECIGQYLGIVHLRHSLIQQLTQSDDGIAPDELLMDLAYDLGHELVYLPVVHDEVRVLNKFAGMWLGLITGDKKLIPLAYKYLQELRAHCEAYGQRLHEDVYYFKQYVAAAVEAVVIDQYIEFFQLMENHHKTFVHWAYEALKQFNNGFILERAQSVRSGIYSMHLILHSISKANPSFTFKSELIAADNAAS